MTTADTTAPPDALTVRLRALVAACDRFSSSAREFEDFPDGYGENLEHLQDALHAFEVAMLSPGDEHVADANARLRTILETPDLVVPPTAARVVAYLRARHRDGADERLAVVELGLRHGTANQGAVDAAVSLIAQAEGRHRALALCDVLGPDGGPRDA